MATPIYISIKISYSKLKIYLLNYFFLFGLVFFILGLLGAIHISRVYNSSYIDNEKLTKNTQGVILNIEKITPTSGEGDGLSFFKYKYSYHIDSFEVIGFGFSDKDIYRVHDEITIYYSLEKPTLSLANNLRNSQFEKDDTVISWILPIFGLLIIFYSILWSNKIFRLLDNGILTNGVLHKTKKNDDTESGGFIHQYVFIDDKGRERKVSQHSMWSDERDIETIVLFDSNDKSNQITQKDLNFFGNKNIKKQIYSAANIVLRKNQVFSNKNHLE